MEERKLPLILYYGTDRIIREVSQRGHIKNFQVTDALRNCFDNVNYFRDFYDWFKTEEDRHKNFYTLFKGMLSMGFLCGLLRAAY